MLSVIAEVSGNLGAVGYGLAAIGPGIGIGLIFAAYIAGVARQPEAQGRLQTIALLGFAFGLMLVVLRLAFGPQWAAEGVFMLFAVLFMFIGAQFVGMGLLGEYIGRIYNDVRARPRYFIQRVVRQPETASKEEDRS